MANIDGQQVRRFLALIVGLALFITAVGCRILSDQDPTGLDALRKDPVLELVYPEAKVLYRVENPRKEVPLEGVTFGAQVRIFYGSPMSDTEIEAFYKEELHRLGWDFLGTASGRLDTYRRLIYQKDPLSLQVGFWYHEDFQRQLPSVDTEGVTTIFELSIFKSEG